MLLWHASCNLGNESFCMEHEMIIQSVNAVLPVKNRASMPAASATEAAKNSASYTVSLSQAAQIPPLPGAVAPPDPTGIPGKPYWTASDMMSYANNDKKIADILAKMRNHILVTSSEMDYFQTTRGDVRSIAALSPAERTLYDKLAAEGNYKALGGLANIGFLRATQGHLAGYGGGTYDPINTQITPANIMKYFLHNYANPGTDIQSGFTALADYLKSNPIA